MRPPAAGVSANFDDHRPAGRAPERLDSDQRAGLHPHPGIAVAADNRWIDVTAATIPWTGALGHVDKRFQPRPSNRLLGATLDLVLLDVQLGRLLARQRPAGGGSGERERANALAAATTSPTE